MRKISKTKGVFDQLDRLQKLHGGKKTIQALIKGPDGHKLIEYYAKTANKGNRLHEVLPRKRNSEPPKDKSLNKPTKKIYTGTMLVKAINTALKKVGE